MSPSGLEAPAATGFGGGGPIYQQIADQISADILSGRLAPDEQVMSTNQYAAFYRINPATAAKAFQRLVDDGLLYKKRGIGMFVSPDAPERLRVRHRERFYADVVDPMVAEARVIGIALDDVIAHIARQDAGRPEKERA
jgi:DNA-binding transcriptional regulator YhcF (GntR family)